jgi:hypothetical protein
MNTYKVIFTIKQAIHPLTETVNAQTVEAAREIVKQMVKDAGYSLTRITAVIQAS